MKKQRVFQEPKQERRIPPTKPIIWLTGQSGAGKTTLAKALKEKIGGVILDGDEMRESISLGAGFSKEDREEHNLRVARLAKVLSKRDLVIVSVIAPFADSRKKIDKIAAPIWVYVKRKLPVDKNKPYDKLAKPDVVVDTDKQNTSEKVESVMKFLANLNLRFYE